jgi:hypothetical protein
MLGGRACRVRGRPCVLSAALPPKPCGGCRHATSQYAARAPARRYKDVVKMHERADVDWSAALTELQNKYPSIDFSEPGMRRMSGTVRTAAARKQWLQVVGGWQGGLHAAVRVWR